MREFALYNARKNRIFIFPADALELAQALLYVYKPKGIVLLGEL